MLNVLIRDDTRMLIRLDRIVLGRQTERVKTDREQYIVALHPALAGYNFKSGIRLDMAYMHTGAAGVRKLDKAVELRLDAGFLCVKNAVLFPFILPLFLDFLEVIFHNDHSGGSSLRGFLHTVPPLYEL